jgi:hypothetical protein
MISYGEYLRSTSRDEALAYSEAREKSSDLAGAIRRVVQEMRMHRDSSGAGGDGDSSISGRLMHCLRAYNGFYSPTQLQEIKKFGGSEGFARITAVKCRSLTALLEDLYLTSERPWTVEPTPVPTLPEDIAQSIQRLVMAEVQGATGPDGEPPDASMILDRMGQLHEAALRAAKERAARQAEQATMKLEDMLIEGGFYSAFKEFLSNFSRFPFAVLKGPYFKMQRTVAYIDKMPAIVEKPIQAFSAPNPFDIWFSPSASKASDGDIVERLVLNRFDLEALRSTPSYDAEAIDAVLSQMPNGHSEWTSAVEQTRADQENRESPMLRDTKGLYDCFEFHGWVEGETAANDPILGLFDLDPDRSHHCTVRMINSIIISAHPNPDPMERVIYHVDSFERVPGSVIGRGLPEVLMDVQGLANAAFRAVINNMGLSSGPQVGINASSYNEGENGAEMYPWKRWTFTPDPAAPTAPPLIFFQPSDNSQNLMNVFDRAMIYADEVSAIPRFSAGGTAGSGAGRTASGLAMLQGNVARVVKQIAGSIDETIVGPVLQIIYDMTLLTDTTGVFRGDEKIRPLGIQSAAKQETEKMRALEMLQITANPIDMQIMGPDARAMLLKEIADNLGFDQGKLGALLDARAKALMQQGTDPTAPPPQQGGTPPGGPPPPGAGQNQQGSMPGPAQSDGGVAAPTEGMMRTG